MSTHDTRVKHIYGMTYPLWTWTCSCSPQIPRQVHWRELDATRQAQAHQEQR